MAQKKSDEAAAVNSALMKLSQTDTKVVNSADTKDKSAKSGSNKNKLEEMRRRSALDIGQMRRWITFCV